MPVRVTEPSRATVFGADTVSVAGSAAVTTPAPVTGPLACAATGTASAAAPPAAAAAIQAHPLLRTRDLHLSAPGRSRRGASREVGGPEVFVSLIRLHVSDPTVRAGVG
ncbi:hypothetical protein Asp14428_03220 [Actinoplanes sp. NBRC 14428]|nr:hypothetical protein Asp14428_03220 [Actinoplanes sp. NBRC 14428]